LTTGGALTLNATAEGGGGGSGPSHGGNGGAATAKIEGVDWSAGVVASSVASGGAAGNSSLAAPGGTGGAATATDDVASTGGLVVSTASAGGGGGGEQSGAGGAANATADASAPGFTAHATASATGGEGATAALAGAATANVSATGAGGEIGTNASSLVGGSTGLETEAGATGVASVNGSAKGYAQTGFDGALAAFQASGATVEYGMAAPDSAAVTAVLAANPNIASAFGSSPDVYALGEVGSAHATAGTDAETSTSTVTFDLNTANLASNEELAIGFYDGDSVAPAGVTNVLLNVTENGQSLIDESYASDAAARTYFADNALGDLLLLSPGGGAVDFSVSLTVSADEAKSGFYGDFIVGGAPEAAALHRTSG
jgi:hypothetical protein